MLFARAFAFGLFLLLAAGMIVWQGFHLYNDVVMSPAPAVAGGFAAAAVLLLAALALGDRMLKGRAREIALIIAGLPLLPATLAAGGALTLIQAQAGEGRKTFNTALTVGGLVGICVALPLIAAQFVADGSNGLLLGWLCIKTQFFLAADFFLGRAILYYFTSGASAFVSLRYLRRRVISLLSVVGIAVGVWVLVVVNSIMTGFQNDFRDQVRGSLSHMLVRFDAARFHNDIDERDARVLDWQEATRRINADETLKSDWQDILVRALERYGDGPDDGDGLPDAVMAQPAPPNGGDNIPDEELSDQQKIFLDRVRFGEKLTGYELSCLVDENGDPTTPVLFLLNTVAEKDRNDLANEIRMAWYMPKFRERLQHEFDKTAEVLRAHKNRKGEHDVEGVSWRVATKVFITPKTGSHELPVAELVGVHPSHETEISDLGKYVSDAEIETFREEMALQPMRNILGALLGWETEASVENFGAKREIAWREDGKRIGNVLPRNMRSMLIRRGFVNSAERIRWRLLDDVEYYPFTPAEKIYQRVREAHKGVIRSDDPKEIKSIVIDCATDVRAMLLDVLAKGEPSADDRTGRIAWMGSKIIFNEYLTSIGLFYREIRNLSRYASEELAFAADSLSDGDERAYLLALQSEIQTLTETTRKQLADPELEETKRRSVVDAHRNRVLKALNRTYSSAVTKGYSSAETIHAIRDAVENKRTPLRIGYSFRAPVMPLMWSVAKIEQETKQVARRREAYQNVLPVRTTLTDDEPIDAYEKRALTDGLRPDNDMPGIIIGEALATSPMLGGVQIGDTIALTIPRIRYRENRLDPDATEVRFRVTGFFRSGLYEDNLGRLFCDFDELTNILGDSETRFIVGAKFANYDIYEGPIKSRELKENIRADLRSHGVAFAGVSVWEDEKRSLLEAVNREKMLLGLIVSFIIVLAGVLVIIVVYQLVNEKVKDIGILKALGHSPWGIRSVFMFNALFIGLFGAIIGASLGVATSEYLNEIEDFIDEMTGIRLFPPDVYFLTYIPSVKGWYLLRLAADISIPTVLWSFFCGILPSIAAARKDAVEALHHE